MSENTQPVAPPVPHASYPVHPASAPAPAPAPQAGYGGYLQPSPGAPPVYAGGPAPASAPVSTRSARLGTVALIVALIAALGATLLSALTAFPAAVTAMAGGIAVSPAGLENLSGDQLLALLSPVRGLVLWAEIGFWAGTALGIWALVQGIVAIATRRGRGAGIAAVVVAALGPVLFTIVVGSTVLAGIAAGANGA